MCSDFDGFLDTFESENTAKVVRSLRKIGEHDYSRCTPILLEEIILGLKPNSPKAITTIVYILSLYAKYLGNNDMLNMIQDIDRNVIWSLAKPNAEKKFISHVEFLRAYNDIEKYEEYNSLYIQTLFRCLYDGIYNDDMSVIKNLRASDINENIVTLKDDSGKEHLLYVSDRLEEDLVKLGSIDTWSRKNRYGECKIKTIGKYKDSCFKVENRQGSLENAYRFSYYRILRKISKEYIGRSVLPLQIYVSGIVYRISLVLKDYGITMEEAFADNNKSKLIRGIILDELQRSNCDTEIRNFRELVKGHIDVFC